jgi:hypothetical protein
MSMPVDVDTLTTTTENDVDILTTTTGNHFHSCATYVPCGKCFGGNEKTYSYSYMPQRKSLKGSFQYKSRKKNQIHTSLHEGGLRIGL